MDRDRALWVGVAGIGLLAAAIVIKKLTGRVNPLQDVVKNLPPPQMPAKKPASHARKPTNGVARARKAPVTKPS